MTLIQAKLIDKILTLLLSRNSELFADEISDRLNIDSTEAEHLLSLVGIIDYQGGEIVTITSGGTYSGDFIEVNFNTQRFVDAGGCEKWFMNQHEKELANKEQARLEKQKLLNDIQAFRISKNQYRFTKWTAIASFVLAAGSILLQVFGVI